MFILRILNINFRNLSLLMNIYLCLFILRHHRELPPWIMEVHFNALRRKQTNNSFLRGEPQQNTTVEMVDRRDIIIPPYFDRLAFGKPCWVRLNRMVRFEKLSLLNILSDIGS